MTDTRLRSTSAVVPRSASPWTVDTRAMGLTKRQGPGSNHALALVAPAPPFTGTAVLAVPEGADVQVTGLLEAVSEGVVVTGTANATAHGTCSRCLREVEESVTARFQELYAYPDSATAHTTDDDEVPRLVEDFIDLEPLVHDELVLAMPLSPLCRPDCPGLCPQCGEPLDGLGPGHRHETMDPRWAALSGLLPAGPDDQTVPPTTTGPGARAGDIEEK